MDMFTKLAPGRPIERKRGSTDPSDDEPLPKRSSPAKSLKIPPQQIGQMTPKTPKTSASARIPSTAKETAPLIYKHATATRVSLYKMLEKLMRLVMAHQLNSADDRTGLLAKKLVKSIFMCAD
jgi:hypothetical protein